MTLREKTQSLLSKHRIQLEPSLDEQQLVDEATLGRFIDYCEIDKTDTVLEIGPGAGNITEGLLKRAKHVIAIEINAKYVPVLDDRFSEYSNFELIRGDALFVLFPNHDRLVSNLPYMICESLFQRSLRLGFKSATFIVSKSFAARLTAEEGTEEYSKLSWQSALFYETIIHETVPPEAYLPEPGKGTAIISLLPRAGVERADVVLKELLLQGDKLTRNALRESLIRGGVFETKRKATAHVNSMELGEVLLDTPVARLSLLELLGLEDAVRACY
ncbi:MAG: hypothetical protein NWE89_09415 [Candidatus Bathyarchaeota archaeon]|nr:hypothetical protein [Candidatus Bathyarchaeota archaeon]